MLTHAAVKQHSNTGAVNFRGHGGEHSLVNPCRVAHYYNEIYTKMYILYTYLFWSMTDGYVVQTHIGSSHHIVGTLGEA